MISEYLSKLLDGLYSYYNKALFQGKLKDCYFNTSLKAGALGSFVPESWTNAKNETIHQIILNPYIFEQEPIALHIAIVHNMLHAYLYNPEVTQNPGYHDKVFAQLSEEIGLPASITGEPGGRKTGQKILHYYTQGGLFIKAYYDSPKEFIEYRPLDLESPQKSKKNKADYLCPNCYLKLYGQPKHKVICGDCKINYDRMIFMIEIEPKKRSNPWLKNAIPALPVEK